MTAHDLRTGIALVLAGLAAEGETVIESGYLIDRGHAHLAAAYAGLGADIRREISTSTGLKNLRNAALSC